MKMKKIYFMRHSEPLKYNNLENNDSLQVQNEKWVLSINGEEIARKKSLIKEFSDFDMVISSNYVRTIATAKYFARNKINVIEAFGERKFGINAWSELPDDFGAKQFNDFNYKNSSGESLNEVVDRELKALYQVLDTYQAKKILIVGHSTALMALFSKWCDLCCDGYKFRGNEFFDGHWNYCETFKLTFDDDNKLIDIENIK